jgi:serine protease Do
MRDITGVVISDDGKILIPGIYNPGSIGRMTVWVGDTEYPAKVLKSDYHLNMTVIKINADNKLVPLSLERLADLKTGSWCVIVTPSGEKKDFVKFTTLGICRGEVDGKYRLFDVDGVSRISSGAPVLDMDGRTVGITKDRNVVSMTDLNSDLQLFMSDAAGVTSPDDEARRKGRLGIMMHSINKEYAKKHGLTKSGLWVTHVEDGTPASLAGIRKGDLIVALNGNPLRLSGRRSREYFTKSLRAEIGREFDITVIRDGKEIACHALIHKRPEDEKQYAKDIGVEVKSITDADIINMNLFTSNGVLITKVDGGSPAATSSSFRRGLLMNGDVIISVGGYPTPTLEEFTRVIDDLRRKHPDVLLVVYKRGLVTGYAGLNLKIGENGKGGI